MYLKYFQMFLKCLFITLNACALHCYLQNKSFLINALCIVRYLFLECILFVMRICFCYSYNIFVDIGILGFINS